MNEKEAWNVFALTGSISDYLHFKSLQQSTNDKAQHTKANDNENSNNRTDNQTTEYR